MANRPNAAERAIRKLERQQDAQRYYETYERPVIAWIKTLHASLDAYRRVPPPEEYAFDLLCELQHDVCLTCWSRRRRHDEYSLSQDHDHETGMLRGLLCASCNLCEGIGGGELWDTYREFAPAAGWFVRYVGSGTSQWFNMNDPWESRPSFASLVEYKRFAPLMDPVVVPPEAHRRFFGGWDPLPLDGERFKTRSEYEEDYKNGLVYRFTTEPRRPDDNSGMSAFERRVSWPHSSYEESKDAR